MAPEESTESGSSILSRTKQWLVLWRALSPTITTSSSTPIFARADEWGEDIEEALRGTKVLIGFVSESAARSPMIGTAHDRRVKQGNHHHSASPWARRCPAISSRRLLEPVLWRGPEDTKQLTSRLSKVVASEPNRRVLATPGGRDRFVRSTEFATSGSTAY